MKPSIDRLSVFLPYAFASVVQDRKGEREKRRATNLEPLVLQHFFDGDVLIGRCPKAAFDETSLEDDAKGAIANDLAVGVGDLAGLAALAVGRDDLDELLRIIG